MKRPARLQSAKRFLATFEGKNILQAYCKHFAVDWRCAVIELRLLGVTLDPNYLSQRERTEQTTIERRQRQREQRHTGRGKSDESFPSTAFDAWLNEDYPLHDALWRQESHCKDELASTSHDACDIPFRPNADSTHCRIPGT